MKDVDFLISWHLILITYGGVFFLIKMYICKGWLVLIFRRFSTICLCCTREQPSTCDAEIGFRRTYKFRPDPRFTSFCPVPSRCEGKSAFALILERASQMQISCHQRLRFAHDNHEDTEALESKFENWINC